MRLFLSKTGWNLRRNSLRAAVKRFTEISSSHLTPEINLHLITPSCLLWNAKPENCVFQDPFWAFYWAGGQALTRYILDNKYLLKDRRVIDIGSGCGACAIAAALCGAKSVVANDLDPVACEAISMNSKYNETKIHIYDKNLIGHTLPLDTDILLVGDMFYDQSFGEMLFNWLSNLKKCGIQILIGDPGRHALVEANRNKLNLLMEYPLMSHTIFENNGFSTSSVWEL